METTEVSIKKRTSTDSKKKKVVCEESFSDVVGGRNGMLEIQKKVWKRKPRKCCRNIGWQQKGKECLKMSLLQP